MAAIARTSLYFQKGSSDKEYHAEIVEVTGGNIVNFRYGRRGGLLTVGTKTASPVDPAQAQKIYDKLVKDKTAKGYTPEVSGVPYQGTDDAGRKTGFMPQLLNPISEDEALRLMTDERWAMQEKMDGERRAAQVVAGTVIGINRKGLSVPLPHVIADELQHIAANRGTMLVDGEIIGDILWIFDLHIHGKRLQALPWLGRMNLAESVFAGCQNLRTVPVAVTADEKRRLWEHVKGARGEGVVFKLSSGPVIEGRPATGGDWLKFKFTESASCCVMETNTGKRSVKLGLLDIRSNAGNSPPMIPVGNVTIPPNHEVPVAGAIVEVEYLYAYRGGSLYQPVYRGQRTDIDACSIGQLKYKPAGREGDET